MVVNSKGRAYTQRVEPKLALVEVEMPNEAFSDGWEPTQDSCLGMGFLLWNMLEEAFLSLRLFDIILFSFFFNASHSNIAFISETFSGHCTWCSFCTLITLDKWKFASQLNIFQIILFSLE